MSTLGDLIVAKAQGWLGVRWRHLGRDRSGLDCVGLLVVAFREAGLVVEDCVGYGRHSQNYALVERLAQVGERVALDALEPGDVLVFSDTRFPGHCAIYAGGSRVIHCSATRRRVTRDAIETVGGVPIDAYRPGAA